MFWCIQCEILIRKHQLRFPLTHISSLPWKAIYLYFFLEKPFPFIKTMRQSIMSLEGSLFLSMCEPEKWWFLWKLSGVWLPKGLFTPRESEKDQRTKKKSKKIFTFAFASAWCEWSLTDLDRYFRCWRHLCQHQLFYRFNQRGSWTSRTQS